MPSPDVETSKLRALYAVDPLRPLEQLDPASDLINPASVSLRVLLVCEVPEESLALFRKQLMPPNQLRKQVAAREMELKHHLAQIIEQLESLGYEVEGSVERGKKMGQVITEVADREKVGLIVLQRRRQKPWQRVLLGSVSDYVSRHARQPLMILPSLEESE